MHWRSQHSANRWILEDLQTIAKNPIGDIGSFLKTNWDTLRLLWWEWSPLAEFSSQWISVWKNKLILPVQITETIKDRNFSVHQILSMMNTDSISLNHLGLRYKVQDLDREVNWITEFMKDDSYTVFEDRAGREFGMRWLFIWTEDSNNPWKPRLDIPMFEIVLIEEESEMTPHIQFDVDTNLSAQEIESKIHAGIRPGEYSSPFNFHLDLENIWRVLSMGTHQNMNWIAHDFWIGTNKRSREAHRETMVKIS